MMANLSERDRRTLTLGAMGVGVIVALYGVLMAVDAVDAVRKERAAVVQRIRDYEAAVLDRATLVGTLRELRTKATIYPNPEGRHRQTAQMLQQVERLPSYRTLSVRRLQALPLREQEGFFRSVVRLQFSGTQGNLHRFLEELQDSVPKLKVERLNLATDQRDPSRLEGQMDIAAFAVVNGGGAGE